MASKYPEYFPCPFCNGKISTKSVMRLVMKYMRNSISPAVLRERMSNLGKKSWSTRETLNEKYERLHTTSRQEKKSERSSPHADNQTPV
jgi:hypothetical protein